LSAAIGNDPHRFFETTLTRSPTAISNEFLISVEMAFTPKMGMNFCCSPVRVDSAFRMYYVLRARMKAETHSRIYSTVLGDDLERDDFILFCRIRADVWELR